MDIRKKQRVVVEALEDIKGRDILVYNTARMPSMFERVVIASGDSTRQVKALADSVQDKIKENGGRVYGVEGEANGEWVLVDLGEIVVHIMHPTVRDFYNLEEVWGGKPVKLATPAAAKLIGQKRSRGKASRPRRKR
ncbi:MAG: ribosome silencing factor [Betaproteobacteria bacterium]|nr:ribosome silencing factor [Betaproteobacteria bacterium]MBV9362091.1 ribosome silencing factor [Betaproteobacteria bacterium]